MIHHLKRGSLLVQILAIALAAFSTLFSGIRPAYAAVDISGLTSACKTDIKSSNAAGKKYFVNEAYNKGDQTQKNGYSSWDKARKGAFVVPESYSSGLYSHPNYKSSPPTTVTAKGNSNKSVTFTSSKDVKASADSYKIFNLGTSGKAVSGKSVTYHNLYHYDPSDPYALKTGRPGYVLVDLKAVIKSYSRKVWDGKASQTKNSYIALSNSVQGFPQIMTFNVGYASIEYSYTYSKDCKADGGTYTMKGNATFDDIDCSQAVGFKRTSKNKDMRFFVDDKTKLHYAHKNGYDYFMAGETKDIDGDDDPQASMSALGFTYKASSLNLLYVSQQKPKSGGGHEAPDGSLTFFGHSMYSMVRPTAAKPFKSVSDKDNVTVSQPVSGSKPIFVEDKDGRDTNTEVNGIGSWRTKTGTQEGKWTYKISQNMPGGMKWHYSSFRFDDDVDSHLRIDSVKVKKKDTTDVTDQFTISMKDNHVSAAAKAASLKSDDFYHVGNSGADFNYVLEITVHIDENVTIRQLIRDGMTLDGGRTARFYNTSSTTVSPRGEEGDSSSDTMKTNQVTSYVKLPDPPVTPAPVKRVSDTDKVTVKMSASQPSFSEGTDKDAKINGVGDVSGSWYYDISQKIPAGMTSDWYYSTFRFDDDIPATLDIESVKVLEGSRDATAEFSVSTKDNHVSAQAKNLSKEDFYGKSGETYTLRITVKLKDKLTLQDMRGAGLLTSDESAIHLVNKAGTTVSSRNGAADKVETDAVDTYIRLKKLPDPEKYVSEAGKHDKDALKKKHTVTLFDDETFDFDVRQALPKGILRLDSFSIKDSVDSCIHVHENIKVFDEKGADVSEKFDISTSKAKDGASDITAKAKGASLSDKDFYGHTYSLRWSNDLKSNVKNQGLSKAWESHKHFASDRKSLSYSNTASSVFNEGSHTYPPYINKGQKTELTPVKKNSDKTTVDIPLPTDGDKDENEEDDEGDPGLSIVKKADRYEYQAESPVKYTVEISNHNKAADGRSKANYVKVTDTDFPEEITLDEDSFKVEGFQKGLKEPDGGERTYRITPKEHGFLFETRYIQYGEKIKISFTAKAGKGLNGSKAANIALASGEAVPNKKDGEIIYINSPKIEVEKTADSQQYQDGDVIRYKITVKNINKGTFARKNVFTDQIRNEKGVSLIPGSVKVYDLDMNPYEEGSAADKTGSGRGDYTVSYPDDKSFKITFTKGNLGYFTDPSVPAAAADKPDKDSLINESYDFEKNYKDLDLMRGYIVTCDASIQDGRAAGKLAENTAEGIPGSDTNGDQVKDDPEIPSGKGSDELKVTIVKDIDLKIEKHSDKDIYQEGQTGRYTLRVTNPKEETAENLVIRDAFDDADVQIDPSSIRVEKYMDGRRADITQKCTIDMLHTSKSAEGKENGFLIRPSADYASLDNRSEFFVTYRVVFTKEHTGRNLRNVARASSDDLKGYTLPDPTPYPAGEGLAALKLSTPANGRKVRGGQTITYTIRVTNTSDKDKKNILVKDQIPKFTEFISSEDGEKAQIKGTDYFKAIIPLIKAGSSQDVSFKVKADSKISSEDIVHNAAGVFEAGSHEDPGSLFDKVSFHPTNTIDHPVRGWVIAENTVKVIPGTPGIDLQKEADRTKFQKGEIVNYSITIKNRGKEDVRSLVVGDTVGTKGALILPDSFVLTMNGKDISRDLQDKVKVSADKGSFTIDTGLDLSETDSLKAMYKVNTSDVTGSELANKAWAQGSNTEKVYDSTRIPSVRTKLQIKKTADQKSFTKGRKVSYELEVRNTGKTEAVNLVISDKLTSKDASVIRRSIRVYKNGKDITRNVKDIQADKTSFVITTGMKAGTEDVYTVNYQVNTKKVDEEYLDNTACASADNAGQVKDSLRLPQKSEDRTDGGGERSDGNGSDNGGAAASSPVKTGDLFSTSVIILFILSAGLMAAAFLLKKKEKDR